MLIIVVFGLFTVFLAVLNFERFKANVLDFFELDLA